MLNAARRLAWIRRPGSVRQPALQHEGTPAELRVDTRVNTRVDTRVDMRVDTRVDTCMDAQKG